jgi:Zn-dependent protease with chaperone function
VSHDDNLPDVPRTETGEPVQASRMHFPEINPATWEHPLDRAALDTLRKIPGLDLAIRKVFGSISERSLRLLYLANSVKVGPDQFADLHQRHLECCSILDMDTIPELFVAQTPLVNAGAIGMDRPFIVLNSGTLQLFDDDEMRLVLGHELAHIASGHVLYKTLLKLMLKFTLPMVGRMGIPVAGLALQGIVMALMEWDRKSELTADRAGLLCVQDPQVVYRAQMKSAGGSDLKNMSVDAFVRQAEEYEQSGDLRDKALKFMNLMGQTHPFPVLRLAELKRWVDSGEYQAVLDGNYPRGGEAPKAAEHAWADPDSADGPEESMSDLIQNLGQTVTDATSGVRSRLKDMMDSMRVPQDDDTPKD